MRANRIGMIAIRQIIQLKNKQYRNRKITDFTGIHRDSVNASV